MPVIYICNCCGKTAYGKLPENWHITDISNKKDYMCNVCSKAVNAIFDEAFSTWQKEYNNNIGK